MQCALGLYLAPREGTLKSTYIRRLICKTSLRSEYDVEKVKLLLRVGDPICPECLPWVPWKFHIPLFLFHCFLRNAFKK